MSKDKKQKSESLLEQLKRENKGKSDPCKHTADEILDMIRKREEKG